MQFTTEPKLWARWQGTEANYSQDGGIAVGFLWDYKVVYMIILDEMRQFGTILKRTRLSCFNVKTKLLKVKTSYFKLSKIILVRLV